MSREIVTYCDNIGLHGDNPVHGVTSVWQLSGMATARELDDCGCIDHLTVADARKVLLERGRKLSDPPVRNTPRSIVKPGPVPIAPARSPAPATPRAPGRGNDYYCLFCVTSYVSPGTLAAHYRAKHGLPGGWADSSGSIRICPICRSEKDSGVGLAMHGRNSHGVQTTSELLRLAWYPEPGQPQDPHGIVRAVVERWRKLADPQHFPNDV